MKKILLTVLSVLCFSVMQGSITSLTLGAMLVGGSVYTGQQAYEEYKKTQSLKSSLIHGGKKALAKLDQATDDDIFDYGLSPDEMKKKKRQREFQRLLSKTERHFDKYHKVYGWSICSILMLHIGLRFLLGATAEQP